jgi:large subunit ribosomal protein L23
MVNLNNLREQIDCIKYPLVTEKSAGLFENNQYTFLVDKKSNKNLIKSTIEFLFNVKVIKVNTCLIKPQKKRVGKFIGYTRTYKKAIVKLSEGNTIKLFPDM